MLNSGSRGNPINKNPNEQIYEASKSLNQAVEYVYYKDGFSIRKNVGGVKDSTVIFKYGGTSNGSTYRSYSPKSKTYYNGNLDTGKWTED